MSSNQDCPKTFGEPRTNVDIAALTGFLDSIRDTNLVVDLQALKRSSLYHYTDLAGFRGIAAHHDLWLTHARYMNDVEELFRGHNIAVTLVRDLNAANNSVDWQAYLTHLEGLLRDRVSQDVYVCCFCETDDQLSQWRSYGANGTGVSIEVNLAGANLKALPREGLMCLWKVCYDAPTQTEILRKVIDFVYMLPGGTPEERGIVAAGIIWLFIPTFKHHGFREENEWRLVFIPQNYSVDLEFRVARGMLVPYYSLMKLTDGSSSPFGWPLITGVRIGPSPHQEMNYQSARMLLNQSPYSLAPVTRSDIPFRA